MLSVQLTSAETFKKGQISNVGSGEMMVITPVEQEAIARVGDDWIVLNDTNTELKKQNNLLRDLVNTQKQQLDISQQILNIEKEKTAFYKEMFETEKENHKRDMEFMKQIIDEQRELIKAAKPSWIERIFPIIAGIAALATLVM